MLATTIGSEDTTTSEKHNINDFKQIIATVILEINSKGINWIAMTLGQMY